MHELISAVGTCSIVIVLSLTLLASITGYCSADNKNRGGPPQVMIWAWERPERLLFVDPETTGIAYLAGTILLQSDLVKAKPRLQSISVPNDVYLVAVVRIEADRRVPPFLTDRQAADTASAILDLAMTHGVRGIQIDFDARYSERNFYRETISVIRRRLPSDIVFSITALASWCLSDSWIDGLDIDEAIPMLFRMGPERADILRVIRERGFSLKICKKSVGISTDEKINLSGHRGGVYIFHPLAWSEKAFDNIRHEVSQW